MRKASRTTQLLEQLSTLAFEFDVVARLSCFSRSLRYQIVSLQRLPACNDQRPSARRAALKTVTLDDLTRTQTIAARGSFQVAASPFSPPQFGNLKSTNVKLLRLHTDPSVLYIR
jgi:hypothetical protein